MEKFRYFSAIVDMLDLTLSTKSKKHIVGGGLLGLALLFGTFAVTVMTAQNEKTEVNNDEQGHFGTVDIFDRMPDRRVDCVCGPEDEF